MIRVPCACHHHVFEVSEDQAGNAFQCPHCGRLVDIPALSDLPHISEDGTYKLEEFHAKREFDRLAKLQRAFSRRRVDEYGREIDLRTTFEELQNAGMDEVPLEMADQIRPGRPKYDPATGQLVRPMDVKEEPEPAHVPVPWRTPALHYARDTNTFPSHRILLELFRTPNLAVMGAIFVMHMLINIMMFMVALGMLLLAVFVLMIIWAIVAHYAIVVEDVGPSNNDELPRPLRDLSWSDDIWGPFCSFMSSLLLCYVPVFCAPGLSEDGAKLWALTFVTVGTVLFPAVLLTTASSGSLLNLRPDRVMRVILSCGGAYLILIATWAAAAIIYVAGFVGTALLAMGLADRVFAFPAYFSPWLSYPLLIAGIFLMHAFTWHLGLQYRLHHDRFGWTLQFHERDPNLPPKRGFEVRNVRPAGRAPVPVIPVSSQPLPPPVDEPPPDLSSPSPEELFPPPPPKPDPTNPHAGA